MGSKNMGEIWLKAEMYGKPLPMGKKLCTESIKNQNYT